MFRASRRLDSDADLFAQVRLVFPPRSACWISAADALHCSFVFCLWRFSGVMRPFSHQRYIDLRSHGLLLLFLCCPLMLLACTRDARFTAAPVVACSPTHANMCIGPRRCSHSLPVRVAMVVENSAAGDGIGPEAEAQKVLVKIQEFFGHDLAFTGAKVGAAWEGDTPTHLQQRLWTLSQKSDGILFGSVRGLVSEQKLPKLREERVARAAHALQPGCESSPFSRTSVR